MSSLGEPVIKEAGIRLEQHKTYEGAGGGGTENRALRWSQLSFGDVVIDLERLQVYRGSQQVYLTPTEFRLLRHLASNPDRPFSRSELIEAVWGYDSEISQDRTVDVHIRHLREKLEEDPTNPRWLVTVRGIGYKFQP